MELALVGLGRMGANITTRLLRGGHQIVAYDLNESVIQAAEGEGAEGARTLAEVTEKLQMPRVVWIMVPAGDPTEQTIEELAEHLTPGDTVVDGGNSNYKDSLRRADTLQERELHFVDVGTSGGVWGLTEGYSMMVGGEVAAIERLRPIFETLAPAPDKGWGHVGPNGAGHFVKMVHNGIEYGLMEAYAEGFELMQHKTEFGLDMHQIAEIWRDGSVVRSWLLDLTAKALAENPALEGIAAYVSDSGEGCWTVVEAIELNCSIPVITLALERRFRSREKTPFSDKLLAAMRHQFGGHEIKEEEESMPNASIEPHLFVILGVTGDLTRRKLLPAVYHLTAQGILMDRCLIVGVARKADLDDNGFRVWVREILKDAGFSVIALERWCDRCLYYRPIGGGSSEDYQALADRIKALEGEHNLSGNRAFYLALPPTAFPDAIAGLGEAVLNDTPGWTRLVIEKPFGRDLHSAQELNRLVHRYFDEPQVYRIDHYQGKETMQNLLVFRFANPIFESLWNRDRVESVRSTVAEELGVEGRADYYEGTGALRDMVQNHLTQFLALIAMEIPTSFESDAIRHEKMKVLRSLAPLRPEQAVLGQYTRGEVDGHEAPGYREEPDIALDSRTETFVALRVEVDSWRWQGVPFYLCTGKRLSWKLTQIDVVFREPPICFFHAFEACKPNPNVLKISLQPDEGFDLCFEVKAPGESLELKSQTLHFGYQDAFGSPPDAYQTLILDVMKGDQTLFIHGDEVETSWRFYAPLLATENAVNFYRAGTWGPQESDQLLAERGQRWEIT